MLPIGVDEGETSISNGPSLLGSQLQAVEANSINKSIAKAINRFGKESALVFMRIIFPLISYLFMLLSQSIILLINLHRNSLSSNESIALRLTLSKLYIQP
jgi:hypothetical protein